MKTSIRSPSNNQASAPTSPKPTTTASPRGSTPTSPSANVNSGGRIVREGSMLAPDEYSFGITQPFILTEANRQEELDADSKQKFKKLKSQLEVAKRSGNMRDMALAYYKLGNLSDALQLYHDAISYYGSFLEVVIDSGDLLGEALAYNRLGISHFHVRNAHNLEKSADYHLRHLEMSRDRSGKFIANCNLGITYLELQDYPTADQCFQQALEYPLYFVYSLQHRSATMLNDKEAMILVYDYLAQTAKYPHYH
jgi:tetratricopeptide (TPR) repeat protein